MASKKTTSASTAKKKKISTKSAVKKTGAKKKNPATKTPVKKKRQRLTSAVKAERLREKFVKQMNRTISRNPEMKELYLIFSTANENTFTGLSRTESKLYSADFIEEIEDKLPALEKIVQNPRRFINEIHEIVPIEKSKRITPAAVRHLAMHSEFIKNVNPDGTVMPEKILNAFSEDEIAIYENRFIMTLIRRLELFIELRYKYIQEHGDTRNSDIVKMTSTVNIGGATFEYEGQLKVVIPSDDNGQRSANEELLERLIDLRRRVLYLAGSPFMVLMSKAIPVKEPIQQTNIIRLNTDYHSAYLLWSYISRYESLGISYSVKQRYSIFNEDYLKELHNLMVASYFSLRTDNTRMPDHRTRAYTIKPKFKDIPEGIIAGDERFLNTDFAFEVVAKPKSAKEIALDAKKEEAKKRIAERRAKEKEKAKLKKQRAKEREAERKEQARLNKIRKEEEAKERKRLAEEEKKRLAAEKKAQMEAEKKKQAEIAEEKRKLEEARKAIIDKATKK